MFPDNVYSPTKDRDAAPAQTTGDATANPGLQGPVESRRLSVPQSEEPLTIRARRPPIDGALLESEVNTNDGRRMTPSPVRPAASQHISIPQPEELPHKTPSLSGPVDCNDRPVHQKQDHESRSRPPSPYPSSPGCATTSQTPSIVITRSQFTFSLRSGGQGPTFHAISPQAKESPHKAPPVSLIDWALFQPTDPRQSMSKEDIRTRALSPYPGPRGRQETRTSKGRDSSSPKLKRRCLVHQVSFPEPEQLPHRTHSPVRPTNQKQSRSRVSSSSSSSSSSSLSGRSRAPSPHPLSRPHRKEILQELEASRTGHPNGIHHSTIGMKDVHNTAPATIDRAALPFMNPQPSLADLRLSNSRVAATSKTEDDQVQQPKQQRKEQRSFQEFWDSFEDFNEHRYDSDGEIRPEYVTFEDVDIDQIPQGHYAGKEAEPTESRRDGWFSRWFGSGRRH
ncbi:hypothetical protein PG991_005471 [Apiospora marii]|uniref:Uncharacterized protein n=1 Tax=Apiospora marii TaxID=335849 RepID=A0ABR1S9A7_9PEZI